MKSRLLLLLLTVLVSCQYNTTMPSYLGDYAEAYRDDPRAANRAWFDEAGYGMFIHYGLYSQLGRGEWVQLRDTIPLGDYAGLKDSFTAENFDAGAICDLALEAGMKYITLTAKHHDGFCLFSTSETDFNVLNSPCGRDLVGELYAACEKKGLALFLYYSYAADWKHPYFYAREDGWQHARPAYPDPPGEYRYKEDQDFSKYVDYVHAQLREILTQYPKIAGIWFDPVMGFYARPDLFPIDSTYALIRELSPHALISFKQGASGDEDFIAPERGGSAKVGQQFEVARRVHELNRQKPKEICNTLQPHAWGYNKRHDGRHKNADEVLAMLRDARAAGANLLLNVGPMGDGSFPDEDVRTLREAGSRLGELDERPNILCILVDDLGYGDLSCMGAVDLQSPNIDRLAGEGMLFSRFYANCTVCSPSRASLLSGCYPDQVGVPGVIRQNEANSWGNLADDISLLPEYLKKAGYRTAIIGKWHLGLEHPDLPNERGFDHFHGFLGDMMDDYWTHKRGGMNWMRLNDEEVHPEGHATEVFTGWAMDYLNEQQGQEEPFFLYLAYNAPHFPIQPPEDWYDQVIEREPGIEEKRAKNVAFVEHLDHHVGLVLKELETLGLAENTLVVFVSDNGGALRFAQHNGELRGGKQELYEGGIRVPAIFRWPGHIPAGSRSELVAMHMDLFPTFCAAAMQPVQGEVDGVSILPELLGREQDLSDRTLYWVRREGGERYGGQAYYAARRGDWKILQNTPFEPLQFFNLAEDEAESRPLPLEGELYMHLRKDLQEHIRQCGSVPWQ